jgi:hypothetical protein
MGTQWRAISIYEHKEDKNAQNDSLAIAVLPTVSRAHAAICLVPVDLPDVHSQQLDPRLRYSTPVAEHHNASRPSNFNVQLLAFGASEANVYIAYVGIY